MMEVLTFVSTSKPMLYPNMVRSIFPGQGRLEEDWVSGLTGLSIRLLTIVTAAHT